MKCKEAIYIKIHYESDIKNISILFVIFILAPDDSIDSC